MSLPLLNSNFFESHSPSQEFFHKWKDLASWNQEFIPLYEWNGILFIGKAQHNSNQKPQFSKEDYLRETVNSLQIPHVLVGAKVKDLSKIWNSWQELELKNEAPQIELNNEIEVIEETNNEALTPLEVPDGLDFNMSVEAKADGKAQEEDPFLFLEKKKEGEPALSFSRSVSAKTPPPPPPNIKFAARTVKSSDIHKEEEEEKTPAPNFDTEKKLEVTEINSIDTIFDRLNAHFQRSMIFMIENNEFVPWKWNEGFTPLENKNKFSYSMSEPSPFRVVNRTLKPYHGPVPENSITQSFSMDWMKKTNLYSCTAFPLFNHNILIGLLLTTNNNEQPSKEDLENTRKAAMEIEKIFDEKSQILRAS